MEWHTNTRRFPSPSLSFPLSLYLSLHGDGFVRKNSRIHYPRQCGNPRAAAARTTSLYYHESPSKRRELIQRGNNVAVTYFPVAGYTRRLNVRGKENPGGGGEEGGEEEGEEGRRGREESLFIP